MSITLLNKGQSLYCHVSAGTVYSMNKGSLKLSSVPQFLDGVAWQADRVLHQGMHYRAERSGWMELQAIETSELLIQQVEPASWWQSLQQLWHGRSVRAFGKG